MQPYALKGVGSYIELSELTCDLLGDSRADLTKHLPTLLYKQLVDLTDSLFRSSIKKAEIVADII